MYGKCPACGLEIKGRAWKTPVYPPWPHFEPAPLDLTFDIIITHDAAPCRDWARSQSYGRQD